MDEVLAAVTAYRVIPVVVLDDPAQATGLGDALAGGGLGVAEITLRTPAALAAIEALAGRDDVLVGAGSVVLPGQVDRAVDAGARFVVSPGLSRSVVERCRQLGVATIPGVATATEIQAALELGLNLLKFFPAHTAGGPPALRSLAAPFGQVSFMPTGGVTRENLAAYLDLPCVAAVGGSWMVPRAALAAGDWGAIRRASADAVKAAAGIVR